MATFFAFCFIKDPVNSRVSTDSDAHRRCKLGIEGQQNSKQLFSPVHPVVVPFAADVVERVADKLGSRDRQGTGDCECEEQRDFCELQECEEEGAAGVGWLSARRLR